MMDKKASMQRCISYRKKILDISQNVTALHAAGAFSATEIVDCIYYGLMSKDENNKDFDTFVMSKGHGCMIQYVILTAKGVLSEKDLDYYCKPEGRLGCHPDYGIPGIEASTGSLGHGLAIATGMAYGDKIKNIKRKVFVVLSDGELQEGSTWEAMMMAANLNLDNLICFLDHNGSQSFGHTKTTHPKFYPILDKVQAFGFETGEVNGHNVDEIYSATINRKEKKPFLLVCNTTKGKGVSFMENKPIWHYRSPTPEEYKIALSEIKEIEE